MKADLKRLLRLAKSQHELGRLLESRIASVGHELRDLDMVRERTLAAIERTSTAGLVFYAAAMRRLADLDASRSSKQLALEELGRKLLRARTRSDILARRAEEIGAQLDRRQDDVEMQEITLTMKATGKPGVLQ